MSRACAAALLLLAPACASKEAPPVYFDAGPPPEACAEAPPLELGRCLDVTDGDTCTGALGEEPVFEAMPPEGSIPTVVGPQSATMFVLSARAAGIDPGDPAEPYGTENPLVEILLTDDEGGELLSLYRARSAFSADPELPDTFVNAGLFVVVDATGGSLSGRVLRADAVLRDAAGAVRCGELRFTAGP